MATWHYRDWGGVGCIVTGVAGGRDAVDVAKRRILDFETGKAYVNL